MSMLTAQCDKLRKTADKLRANGFIEDAFEVRHAADTIENLRNRLTEQTCHRTRGKFEEFDYCSECGGMLARWIERDGSVPCYCPSCGRLVVE